MFLWDSPGYINVEYLLVIFWLIIFLRYFCCKHRKRELGSARHEFHYVPSDDWHVRNLSALPGLNTVPNVWLLICKTLPMMLICFWMRKWAECFFLKRTPNSSVIVVIFSKGQTDVNLFSIYIYIWSLFSGLMHEFVISHKELNIKLNISVCCSGCDQVPLNV